MLITLVIAAVSGLAAPPEATNVLPVSHVTVDANTGETWVCEPVLTGTPVQMAFPVNPVVSRRSAGHGLPVIHAPR